MTSACVPASDFNWHSPSEKQFHRESTIQSTKLLSTTTYVPRDNSHLSMRIATIHIPLALANARTRRKNMRAYHAAQRIGNSPFVKF